jgi:hypothetical protein
MSARVRHRCGLAVLLVAAAFGCAGKQDPGGPGQDCYRDQDCKSGLVCVANANNNRVCSADVSGLKSMVEGPPPDAGAVMDDAASQAAGGGQ